MNAGLACKAGRSRVRGRRQPTRPKMRGLPSRPSWRAWPGGGGSEPRGPSCPSSLSPREWPGGGHRPGKGSAVSRGAPMAPAQRSSSRLTSVFTRMTPSSVSVLVSITGIPSAAKSAKIFCRRQTGEVPQTSPPSADSDGGSAHLALLRQLADRLHVTLVGDDDEGLRTEGLGSSGEPGATPYPGSPRPPPCWRRAGGCC